MDRTHRLKTIKNQINRRRYLLIGIWRHSVVHCDFEIVQTIPLKPE